MWFFKNLFTRKSEPSFNQKNESFVAALQQIEIKHLPYFRDKLIELVNGLPDCLKNHYQLQHEFEYVRFDYHPGSDLPKNIRLECDEAYQKIWGNN